jgi:phage baseplate assembly protein gpV
LILALYPATISCLSSSFVWCPRLLSTSFRTEWRPWMKRVGGRRRWRHWLR